MKLLAIADLKDWSEEQIATHLIDEYGANRGEMDLFSILIAYESVGNYGCDSTSFFLLQEKKTQKLYCVHGSHCSCHGFEDQFKLEETTVEYLKSPHFSFYCGGYDSDAYTHREQVANYLKEFQVNIWHSFFD